MSMMIVRPPATVTGETNARPEPSGLIARPRMGTGGLVAHAARRQRAASVNHVAARPDSRGVIPLRAGSHDERNVIAARRSEPYCSRHWAVGGSPGPSDKHETSSYHALTAAPVASGRPTRGREEQQRRKDQRRSDPELTNKHTLSVTLTVHEPCERTMNFSSTTLASATDIYRSTAAIQAFGSCPGQRASRNRQSANPRTEAYSAACHASERETAGSAAGS